jgi:MerR family transcriptional regulator/heat shock protein HspR
MTDRDELFFISMAARELGMHPQTLRKYERLGLVQPTRTIGSVRVYSRGEIDRLRLIKHMVDEAGINLAGVQRLLDVADVVRRMQPMVAAHTPGTVASRRRLARELEQLMAMVGL